MKQILLFLNSFLLICTFSMRASNYDHIEDYHQLQRYSFQIETEKAFVSGLLLLNDNDNSIVGSMINEFGVSALDFIYSKKKQKIKLLSVISFLNKWYIKMILKNDIKFCLHILYNTPYKSKHNYKIVHLDDTILIINHKQKIKYSFTPLNVNEANDTEE